MNEIDFLQQYTDAVKDSTNRTRQILLMMIIASILIFAAFWNSREGGWSNSRLGKAKASFDILERQQAQDIASLLQSKGLTVPAEILARAEVKFPPAEGEIYQDAQDLVNRSPGKSLKQAADNLFWTQKIRTEQVGQIQVPVLGISFDVNDLGLLGGFTLIVLLVWVNYSVWHHSNNLRLTFNFARELSGEKPGNAKLLYHTYQNLAMRQVLTIPPRAASTKSSETDRLKVWIRKASKLLYGLPLLVQTTVLAHDWATQGIGGLINRGATRRVLITETVFWVLIATLTFVCFDRWRKTYNTWKAVADEI